MYIYIYIYIYVYIYLYIYIYIYIYIYMVSTPVDSRIPLLLHGVSAQRHIIMIPLYFLLYAGYNYTTMPSALSAEDSYVW